MTNSTDKGELTPLQHNILQILYFSNPKTLSALSQCMNMNMPNTSREVKKLVLLELIIKSQSPDDKRIVDLTLTEAGQKIIEYGLNKMKTEFFRNSGDWTEERTKRYLESLTILEQELFGS